LESIRSIHHFKVSRYAASAFMAFGDRYAYDGISDDGRR
jgi:hypothetical protein